MSGTLTGAITDYADAMLEAQITRSQSHYDASQTRFNAMESAMNAYTQSSFDAMQAAAKKYRDAAVKEIKDNAKDEKDIKEKEKDHYDNIAQEKEDELETITRPLEEELWSTRPAVIDPNDQDAIDDLQDSIAAFGTWQSGMTTFGSATKELWLATNTAKPSRDTALKNNITASKTANENTRKDTDQQTEKEYKNTENNDWNAYYASTIGAETTYLTSHKQTENAFHATKKTQDDAYDVITISAWDAYSNKLSELESLFATTVTHADNSDFNAGVWFTNNTNGDQSGFRTIALKTNSDNKKSNDKDDDPIWFLKASKNGINSTVSKAWKWISKQNDTLYCIDNCTNDANRQAKLVELKYDRLEKGENIDVSN